jgi:hypothetical protein
VVSYNIKRAQGPVPLCGESQGQPWQRAEVAPIDEYPWFQAGRKQRTEVRLLWDDQALYAQFVCEDVHIFAQETRLNGKVCADSCVELFAAPQPDKREDYFNLEVNCCGVFMLGMGPGRHGRSLIDESMARQIEIVSSESAAPRDERPDDRGWWVAMRLPFAVVGAMAGHDVSPQPGDEWKGNFYRCGGKSDDQYATWAHIDAPKPDYHRPEQFGRLIFTND